MIVWVLHQALAKFNSALSPFLSSCLVSLSLPTGCGNDVSRGREGSGTEAAGYAGTSELLLPLATGSRTHLSLDFVFLSYTHLKEVEVSVSQKGKKGGKRRTSGQAVAQTTVVPTPPHSTTSTPTPSPLLSAQTATTTTTTLPGTTPVVKVSSLSRGHYAFPYSAATLEIECTLNMHSTHTGFHLH